jgi:hypothetical protein
MAIELPKIETDAGLLCRMLLAECRTPEYTTYSAKDAITSMRAMRAVVENRLAHPKPKIFNAPGAKTWRDIITASGQWKGFNRKERDGGTYELEISDAVQTRIAAILKTANNSGAMQEAMKAHVQLAVETAEASQNEDPFASISEFIEMPLKSKTKVEKGVYAFRTFGSGSPGANFAAYPQSLGGVIMRNQFFALRAERDGKLRAPNTKTTNPTT